MTVIKIISFITFILAIYITAHCSIICAKHKKKIPAIIFALSSIINVNSLIILILKCVGVLN